MIPQALIQLIYLLASILILSGCIIYLLKSKSINSIVMFICQLISLLCSLGYMCLHFIPGTISPLLPILLVCSLSSNFTFAACFLYMMIKVPPSPITADHTPATDFSDFEH